MKALRELRDAVGETQVQFAARIGKSYNSIQRYEGQTPPKGKALIPFIEIARTFEQYEIARILKAAAVQSLPEELMLLIRDKGPEDEQTPEKETGQQSPSHKRRIRA